MMLNLFLLPIFLSINMALAQDNYVNPLLLRFPDVSENEIVFVYSGDLWLAPINGGTARRLSSPKGQELFPRFSPDGNMVAFSGNYDGNVDVYTISTKGGTAKRLTHHPADDLVVDWHPNGSSILYRSKMQSHRGRYNKLFLQPIEGGLPSALPFYYGELASFSPNGGSIAFQYSSRQLMSWKRYAGGMASDIWIYNFIDNKSTKFTDYDGTDAVPMWYEDKIYFLSDRGSNKKLNIWVYDLTSDTFKQITKFGDYDVKWPSIGPDKIVFENGGVLFLLNLKDDSLKKISIIIPDDAPNIRPKLKNLKEYIYNFNISPTGKNVLIEARGEIISLAVENGNRINLTKSSSSAQRSPAWSPNGKYITYFSDQTGEYELYIQSANNYEEPRKLSNLDNGFYFNPVWSPNNRYISFSDNTGKLFVIDINTQKQLLVDTDNWRRINRYSWSPDSRWLAYSKQEDNGNSSIYFFDSDTGKTHKVTNDFFHDAGPVFDLNGKYLYFYSNRDFNALWGDFDDTWIYPNATGVFVLTLKDNYPSPTLPKIEEENTSEKEKPNNSSKKEIDKSIDIDFESIEKRISKLPIEPGNFGRLSTGKNKVIFLRMPNTGSPSKGGTKGELFYYDLQKREEKKILQNVNDYRISHDRKKFVYKSNSSYGISDLFSSNNKNKKQINVNNLKAWVDPQEEWKQIFHESWRIERDFFYDPNMHGVDWDEVRNRYSTLLQTIKSRNDLNYLIGEMIAELNSSHTYVGGGDIETAEQINVGMLGCEFELDKGNNAFRISMIYDPGSMYYEVNSPLRSSEYTVKEGDFILAVNGEKISKDKDPWYAFQGLSGEIVAINFANSDNINSVKTLNIKLLTHSQDKKLRYYDWIEKNRTFVEKMSEGNIGYIYVPDTGRDGQSELLRQFIYVNNKKGLIIDERFNSGGQIPDRFIELLNRPILSYWARRNFKDNKTPKLSNDGPKAMIINEWSGSGGDAFPYYFKQTGLGPLIGKRTLGGLIGINYSPKLIDGGYVTAPSYAFWNTDGDWDVEGFGVQPDIEIEITPTDMVEGNDTQLRKAVEIVLDLINDTNTIKNRPVYPNRSNLN